MRLLRVDLRAGRPDSSAGRAGFPRACVKSSVVQPRNTLPSGGILGELDEREVARLAGREQRRAERRWESRPATGSGPLHEGRTYCQTASSEVAGRLVVEAVVRRQEVRHERGRRRVQEPARAEVLGRSVVDEREPRRRRPRRRRRSETPPGSRRPRRRSTSGIWSGASRLRRPARRPRRCGRSTRPERIAFDGVDDGARREPHLEVDLRRVHRVRPEPLGPRAAVEVVRSVRFAACRVDVDAAARGKLRPGDVQADGPGAGRRERGRPGQPAVGRALEQAAGNHGRAAGREVFRHARRIPRVPEARARCRF